MAPGAPGGATELPRAVPARCHLCGEGHSDTGSPWGLCAQPSPVLAAGSGGRGGQRRDPPHELLLDPPQPFVPAQPRQTPLAPGAGAPLSGMELTRRFGTGAAPRNLPRRRSPDVPQPLLLLQGALPEAAASEAAVAAGREAPVATAPRPWLTAAPGARHAPARSKPAVFPARGTCRGSGSSY